ncbi:glutathione S-transferase family protein [Salinimonas lutimaris]|uniref:glutathione S-transferase family protein n=1 Tax=Salinimonas lutimaris TaxID=914153 RepID=UPI0010C07A85|nr:glutathione S-transferase family protein [Salinimonas lutimaris]
MIELYHNDMSVCAQKVRLVLAHKNISWHSKHLNLRSGEQFNPEFLRINPKAIIPVLVHDGAIITESNVICYYLEEVFSDNALMSIDPVKRAESRIWLTRLDAGLHEQIAVLSFCLAFRQQILTRYSTAAALESFFSNIPDPSRQMIMRDMVQNGTASPRFELALHAYKKVVSEIAAALQHSDWLVDSGLSLADYGYLPYIERLDQLGLSLLWDEHPQIDRWLARLQATDAYQSGMQQWHNQDYIELMKHASSAAVAAVKQTG